MILQGDALEQLRGLPDASVDCCVTSPPYYALRDYGTGEWVGGDPNCPHYRTTKYSESTATGHKAMMETGNPVGDAIYKKICPVCGAVRVDKQIGLEDTPEAYIQRLVDVFHEVKRVLKDDGTLWLNIGDSYWGSGSRGYDFTGKWTDASEIQSNSKGTENLTEVPKLVGDFADYKNKDLIGIPWMLAFALRKDGWYLRQDIIWHKPNPMPESVKDRCTKSHEYIFLLSKKPHYYFDYEAIQEEAVCKDDRRKDEGRVSYEGKRTQEPSGGQQAFVKIVDRRNKRDVWNSNSKYESIEQESSVRQGMNRDRGNNIVALRKNLPTQEEFVDFMRSRTDIATLERETGIARTTIEHWFRKDESGFSYPSVEDWLAIRDLVDDWSDEFTAINQGLTEVTYETDAIDKNDNGKRNKRDVWSISPKPIKEAHFATFPEELVENCIKAGCPKGGVVLDPFFGSGTTGIVATAHNREYIGIELNPKYIEIAEGRLGNVQLQLF